MASESPSQAMEVSQGCFSSASASPPSQRQCQAIHALQEDVACAYVEVHQPPAVFIKDATIGKRGIWLLQWFAISTMLHILWIPMQSLRCC